MTVVKRPHTVTMLYVLPYGVKCSSPHWKKIVVGIELLAGTCWRICYIYFPTKFKLISVTTPKGCHSVTYLFECSGMRLERQLTGRSCQVALISSIPKCLMSTGCSACDPCTTWRNVYSAGGPAVAHSADSGPIWNVFSPCGVMKFLCLYFT
jgi:hypothetical protein